MRVELLHRAELFSPFTWFARAGGGVSRAARCVKLYLLLVVVIALATAGTAAEAQPWSVLDSSGPVLILSGGQWADLPVGEGVEEGVPIRTLKHATITLSHPETVVMLADDSAAQLDEASDGTVVTQFAGTVTVKATLPGGRTLLIRTPSMTVSARAGPVQVKIQADTGKVEVSVGTVTVVDTKSRVQKTIGAGADEVTDPAPNLDLGAAVDATAQTLGAVASPPATGVEKPSLVEKILPD